MIGAKTRPVPCPDNLLALLRRSSGPTGYACDFEPVGKNPMIFLRKPFDLDDSLSALGYTHYISEYLSDGKPDGKIRVKSTKASGLLQSKCVEVWVTPSSPLQVSTERLILFQPAGSLEILGHPNILSFGPFGHGTEYAPPLEVPASGSIRCPTGLNPLHLAALGSITSADLQRELATHPAKVNDWKVEYIERIPNEFQSRISLPFGFDWELLNLAARFRTPADLATSLHTMLLFNYSDIQCDQLQRELEAVARLRY